MNLKLMRMAHGNTRAKENKDCHHRQSLGSTRAARYGQGDQDA